MSLFSSPFIRGELNANKGILVRVSFLPIYDEDLIEFSWNPKPEETRFQIYLNEDRL